MEKVKLFTHTDLDGVVCGILAKLAFKNVDISYCNYDDINEEVEFLLKNSVEEYSKIYITDISVNEEIANLIDSSCPEKVLLLDHHPTALNLNKFKWSSVKVSNKDKSKTCGASIYFKHLLSLGYLDVNNRLLQTFVEKVRRYDTWEWERLNDKDAENLNNLLYLYGKNMFTVRFLVKILNNEPTLLNEVDLMILNVAEESKESYIRSKIENIKVTEIDGYLVGVVFAEKHTSLLGSRLGKIYPKLDFFAIINMDKGTVSYRTSKENIDLGKFASNYGGGGHKASAGSPISSSLIGEFINKIYN